MTWSWDIVLLLIQVLIVIGYAIPLIMLFIIPTNRKPSSATAWLLTMLLLPYLGLFIYILIGNPKLPARRRAQQRTATEFITETVAQARAFTAADQAAHSLLDPAIPEQYKRFVALNLNLGGVPAYAGNSVELLPDYAGSLERIVEAINEARYFVHI